MSPAIVEKLENLGLVSNADGKAPVVLVCEHASNHMPKSFNGLGMRQADRSSHAAWDPGALAVAEAMSNHLDTPLLAGTVSRLIYDCNRPPESPDAMPSRSEIIEIPGNRDLSSAEREARVADYYRPFQAALKDAMASKTNPVLVTIHSFTPLFHGVARGVEIGILHDSDTRLADAMLQKAAAHTETRVERNQPYGPEDGVTHTLREHGLAGGHLNVMIEVRNDLIATSDQQSRVAATLSRWLAEALASLSVPGDVQCRA